MRPLSSSRAAAVVLLAGLALSVVMGLVAEGARRANDDRSFDRLGLEARASIEREIAGYAEVLYGARAAFPGGVPNDDERFTAFIDLSRILSRRPGAQAISFNRAVRTADLGSYEQLIRDESGSTGFRVYPRPTSSVAYVIEKIAPLANNRAAVGFDTGATSERRAAIEAARDTGDLFATPPVELIQTLRRGVLMVLASYRDDRLPVTGPARRRRFEGVMTVVLDCDDLIRGLFGRDPKIRLEIYDVGLITSERRDPLTPERLVFDIDDRRDALQTDSSTRTHRYIDLNVGSRRWRMYATPASTLSPLLARVVPWLIFLAGAALSGGVAAMLGSSARARTRALAIAEGMTADLRERERDLEAANDQLNTANESLRTTTDAMRDFVAVVSHEMRTPLTSVRGFSEVLRVGWDSTPPDQRVDYLATIERSAARLARLVDNLLTSSRLESGTLDAHPVDVVVSRAIAETLAEADAADVEVRCPPDLTAHVDADHLQRMLINYVSNAQKYGEPPIRIEVSRRDQWVDIQVIDAGPGVADEFAGRLFEKFARAGGSTIRGTGLGLSIVRGLATANGGEAYHVDGAPGACFGLRLPALRPSAV